MAAKADSKALKHPDGTTDAVEVGRAAGGSGTASGQEAARRAGKEKPPKGADAGSKVKTGVPVPPADYLGKGNKPMGNQKKTAAFVSNGALVSGMVASPSGPVPASAATHSVEDHATAIKKHEDDFKAQHEDLRKQKKLSQDQINSMRPAELRAVASDRGYKISDAAGTRGTRAAFHSEQENDKFAVD